MSSLFEAYITNLGKYNEGRLVGETLKFPATTEEVQALLKRIGVDGVRYEEIFITSFDGDVLGLYDHLGEYESIDELNHLAHVLSDLDQSDIEKFEAVIDSGEYTGSVHDLINLAQNLDCYDFYPGIDSEEALGRAYIEEMEMLDVPDNVLPYQNVFLTDEELADLQASFPTVWGQYIEKLSEYMASTGKRYQSHAATIRRWAGEDAKKAAPPTRNRDYSVKEDETV